MLKVPDHQAVGHVSSNGVLGPVVDGSGRFFKPLKKDDRGSNEAAFYTSFSSNKSIPHHIRRFFPQFYGTMLLPASDGSGLRTHLVLEDIVFNYANPSVLEAKIGSRTWHPEASEDYIAKCMKKDRERSSLQLGFRLSGVQMSGIVQDGYWRLEKKTTTRYFANECNYVLSQFVSSLPSAKWIDCRYASAVYGGSGGILSQLKELKAWLEEQTMYHFYSSSVLIMYDGEAVKEGTSPNAVVKLVGFEHAVEGKGVIDHNFLGGLCSLIHCISRILRRPSLF